MNEDEFWIIIEKSRENLVDPWKQHEQLKDILLSMPEDKIIEFSIQFTKIFYKAYRWDLWAVVYIIEGGCSDDGFMDFRGWLIAQGKEYYEKCLASPESVAERADDSIFYEEMSNIDNNVYHLITGKIREYNDKRFPTQPNDPTGKNWIDSDLPKLYPELCKKYKFRP